MRAFEYKVTPLRETTSPTPTGTMDTPETVADYYRQSIPSADWFDPFKEMFVVVLLTTRSTLIGHVLVAVGTLDTVHVHPREVFRAAIVAGAASIVMIHNHPSGDPTPSESDIRVTRELINAGKLLKIEAADHLIMGQTAPGRNRDYVSLRELGYFYN